MRNATEFQLYQDDRTGDILMVDTDTGEVVAEERDADMRLLDYWKENYLNRFWSSYFDSNGNSCPSCRSSNFVEQERELDVHSLDTDRVVAWYVCDDCGRRWQNDDEAKFKYGT